MVYRVDDTPAAKLKGGWDDVPKSKSQGTLVRELDEDGSRSVLIKGAGDKNKKDNDAPKEPKPLILPNFSMYPNRGEVEERNIKPGEYSNILQKYKETAEKLNINNPPPLRVILGESVGTGGTGIQEGVILREKVLKALTDAENRAVIAHELGHVKDQRDHKHFDSWKDCETHADILGIGVTGDPEAAISGLEKIAKLKIQEMKAGINENLPGQLRKALPNMTEEQVKAEVSKAINRVEPGLKEMLEWRTAGIRSIKPPSNLPSPAQKNSPLQKNPGQ